MKNFTFILAALLLLLTSCEYNPGVSEAFTKYRHKDGVTAISIPGWVIGLASNFSDLDDGEQELLQSIDKVRILVVEDEELNGKINLHKEFSSKINKKNNYEELLSVQDKDENLTIYGVMKNDMITEMVILVGGDDKALIYVRGEISPDLLKEEINTKKHEKFLSLNQ